MASCSVSVKKVGTGTATCITIPPLPRRPIRNVINLRSDGFSLPTEAMKDVMITAPLHHDEDPTVNKLQEECAKLLGKEAALLVPTGIMGNLLAILSHCDEQPRDVLLGDLSHMYLSEMDGITNLAGVDPKTVQTMPDGTLSLKDLLSKIRDNRGATIPRTILLCLENSHARCGGRVLSLDYMKEVKDVADAHNLLMHLDGARLMNAACALEVPAVRIAQYFDSVSMCFTKGLCCPVGGILAGSKDFIVRATRTRKVLGGEIRQAGVIAAPMLVALTDIVPLLKEDHARARKIAEAVAAMVCPPSEQTVAVEVDYKSVKTNIVFIKTPTPELTAEQLRVHLEDVTPTELSKGVADQIRLQTTKISDKLLQLVTYHDITDEDVDNAILKLRNVLTETFAEVVTQQLVDLGEEKVEMFAATFRDIAEDHMPFD